MAEPVIVDAVRTPIGRNKGAFREARPDALYAKVLNALIERTGLPGEKIEDVVTGCVTQVGDQATNIGRLGVLLSDLPQHVPSVSINRMCGSSQQAVHFAAQEIAAGDAQYAIGGGVESMTRVPMFSDLGGGFELLNPQLREKYELIHQGESAERVCDRFGLSRQDLDQFAFQSHQRAAEATKAGHFREQLVTAEGLTREGKLVTLDRDEGIRFEPDLEKMASLDPVFRSDGKVTAANSSQISDGAAAVLLADRQTAKADGLTARARFRARVAVAGDPTMQLIEVIPATQLALKRAKLSLSDMDVIEVNEAFASVVLAWEKELKADVERVNPNGGAIAHGHPLGATGAVLMTKLICELERRDGQFGLQVMCIGHGMATATIIERL